MALENINDLNLGSENALQAAPPEGAALRSAMPNPLAGIPERTSQSLAVPPPPQQYVPGPTSAVRQAYENNPMFRFASGLASWGEAVPHSMQLRLAEQEAQLKLSHDKLAWDTHNDNKAIIQDQLKNHNVERIKTAQGMLPMYKAMLEQTPPGEDRDNLLNSLASTLEGMSPGTGQALKFYAKNAASVYMMDGWLSHPDPAISAPFKSIVARLGYEKAIQTDEWKQLAAAQLPDLMHQLKGRFSLEDQQKLANGKMTEEEFRVAAKNSAYAQGMNPVLFSAANAYMDQHDGQKVLHDMKVQLTDTAMKQEAKLTERTPEQQVKDADLKRANDVLEFEAKHPGSFDKAKLVDAQDRIDRATGQKNKESSYSDNNPLVPFLLEKSGGEFKDPVAMMETVDKKANPKEYSRRLGILKAANDAKAAATSEGQMGTKMSTPGDTSNYIYADQLLKTGKMMPVREKVSAGDLLANKNFLKTTPEQRKQLTELGVTAESAKQIFDEAANVFSGKNSAMSIAAAETALMSTSPLLMPGRVAAKAAYPELANYIARREGTLGKFARSVSGEVGVLTDQDVVRVRNLFPVGGDTPAIIKSKQRALNALVALNKRFAVQVLAGELSPDEAAILKESPEYKSAVGGILGSAAGLQKSEPEAKSLAEPAGSKASRGESLLEKMRAQ